VTASASRFWERPVVPAPSIDPKAIRLFRASAFPSLGDPTPWLDRPDAEGEIARRLAEGEIDAADAALCRKWSRDGYLILEGFYDTAHLDETWASYEAAIAPGVVKPPHEPLYPGDTRPGRLLNPHFGTPAIDALLHEPRMGRIVSLLMGAASRPFQTIAGHKSSQQLPHSDSIHMTTYPLGYLAANWIAFEDIDARSGPLVYYPSSHRLPYLMSEQLGIDALAYDAGYARLYEPAVQRLIAEQGFQPSYFLAKKGDVLLWHANLLHGGSKVDDVTLTRKALVCHFFAQGAVCYHDLSGRPAHTQMGLDLYEGPPGVVDRVVRLARTHGVRGLVRKALQKVRG
jgi:hypothetical protein